VIGDNRPGVGVLSANDIKLPDMVWREVPEGSVVLEDGAGTFHTNTFFIAKYPVTYSQFQEFVNDAGYSNDKWWHGLSNRATMPRNQRYKSANQPRENIWWGEAVAYCRWLTEEYSKLPSRLPNASPNWVIRLPTEWEWQQAATGGKSENEYPWGYHYDDLLPANTQEAGLGRPIAVGMYPDGMTPNGVMDMCGNIWEWCLNEYVKPANINIDGNLRRSRRGGSFEWQFYRSSFRSGFEPYFRYDNYIGFRVVYASILEDH
jgi:formylglycine-generating enzyme required for sulfatase activity